MAISRPLGSGGQTAYAPTASAPLPIVTPTRSPSHSVDNIYGLDLASGMTAGIGPEQSENQQYVDGQYGTHPKWWPAIVRHGAMRNIYNVPTTQTVNGSGTVPTLPLQSGAAGQFFLNFLYNPNQIAVSFDIDGSMVPTVAQLSSGIPAIPSVLNGQQVSWSLYFDRTYDIMKGAMGASRGVLQDVAALYNIIGMFTTFGNTALLNPVEVVFAQESSSIQAIWGFTGFVTSVNITYGIFKPDMMPSRCEIDLTMTARYFGGGSVPSTDSSPSTPLAAGLAGKLSSSQASQIFNNSLTTSGSISVSP